MPVVLIFLMNAVPQLSLVLHFALSSCVETVNLNQGVVYFILFWNIFSHLHASHKRNNACHLFCQPEKQVVFVFLCFHTVEDLRGDAYAWRCKAKMTINAPLLLACHPPSPSPEKQRDCRACLVVMLV